MSTSTTVWLARHGEVSNPSKLLYGRLPRMRLSPEGHRQARALSDYLEPRPLAAIYSSPMLRARRTAETILASQPALEKIRIDSDLLEVRTAWQGEALATLADIDYDFYAHPRNSTDESLRMIRDRMFRWIARILRRHAGAEVVGVSHGDPILILVGALQGLPLDPNQIFPRPYVPTGCLYELQFDAQRVCRDIRLLVPHAEAAA